MSYDYDDYLVWFENDINFKPIQNNYKNTKQRWSNSCNHICLNCGKGVENIETGCEKCNKTDSIVAGNELGGKPCPVCGTALNDGILFKGFEAYRLKSDEIQNIWFNIYRERYHVEKPVPPVLTNEEIAENKRRMTLEEIYCMDYTFILNNPNNALRFEFKDAWMRGYNCIIEWGNNIENKFILFKRNSTWIEKNISSDELQDIIKILNKYNFFKRRFFLDKYSLKLDGYTFGLEVKLDDKYRELCIWGIRQGILYDMGMLLLKIAGKTFNDFHEYAW